MDLLLDHFLRWGLNSIIHAEFFEKDQNLWISWSDFLQLFDDFQMLLFFIQLGFSGGFVEAFCFNFFKFLFDDIILDRFQLQFFCIELVN